MYSKTSQCRKNCTCLSTFCILKWKTNNFLDTLYRFSQLQWININGFAKETAIPAQSLQRVSWIPPLQQSIPRQWCVMVFVSDQSPVSNPSKYSASSHFRFHDSVALADSGPKIKRTRVRLRCCTSAFGLHGGQVSDSETSKIISKYFFVTNCWFCFWECIWELEI